MAIVKPVEAHNRDANYSRRTKLAFLFVFMTYIPLGIVQYIFQSSFFIQCCKLEVTHVIPAYSITLAVYELMELILSYIMFGVGLYFACKIRKEMKSMQENDLNEQNNLNSSSATKLVLLSALINVLTLVKGVTVLFNLSLEFMAPGILKNTPEHNRYYKPHSVNTFSVPILKQKGGFWKRERECIFKFKDVMDWYMFSANKVYDNRINRYINAFFYSCFGANALMIIHCW